MKRRSLLKLVVGGGAGASAGGLSTLLEAQVSTVARANKLEATTETTTICPYCGCGCGIVVSTRNGKVVNTEGDPDHPINEGALCSKGAALYQVAVNERRAGKVLYRAAGAFQWEEKPYQWAVEQVAKRIKKTRDESFVRTNRAGVTVNRTMGIANFGGAALDNEECMALSKFARALGIVNIDHQARLCHSSTVAGLAASFGRGAMTNHWIDIRHADLVMVIGSNPAENHPMSFRWVTRAKEHGAKVITIDPRFTRTAAVSDVYAPMRSGTDIAFIGGIINYLLTHDRIQKDYVLNHTNAAFLVAAGYGFADGLFTGYHGATRKYDKTTWGFEKNAAGQVVKDPTLQHPRCVYQVLKRHYARYTPELVSSITGTPLELYLKVCGLVAETSAPDKTMTMLYAMGTTQHTLGTQNIRAYSILQLLLGNIGLAGGGINAMRGESNVQGSSDAGLLYHLLPGYLPAPTDQDVSLAVYRARNTPQYADPRSPNWWQNRPKYLVSLLKAWWGKHASATNDFAYDYLPKRDRNYSHIAIFEGMLAGEVKGAMLWGQNPAVGGPNANAEREALGRLDWLVCVDLWKTDTSIFWKRPGVDPAAINTEVFFFPAAASVEKEGSVTNSGRWAQWRYKVQEPPGDAKPDLEIMSDLVKAVKQEYAQGGVLPEPIVHLHWDYDEAGRHGPSPHKVAREVNGYFTADVDFPAQGKSFKKGDQVPSFAFLTDDGRTTCGCWVMAGSYVTADHKTGNMMARRDKTDAVNGLGLYPKWAWAWPVNRRILYNRASCDSEGRPYAPQKWVVRWNPGKKAWEGDVPDGPWPPLAAGADGRYSFIMNPEGHAYLFSPVPIDGPMPEHYEPYESPVRNLLNPQPYGPAVEIALWRNCERETGTPDHFPIVATTFRLSEHWQAGAMTRNLPWLAELQPDMFVELSEELAHGKGIKTGDRVAVTSARGELTAYALVTKRFKPMTVAGKTVHQIGLPWHWGYAGIATGDSANLLTPHVGDANTTIPEYKVFLCDLRKA